jgi:hypothetical protein
MKHKIKIRIRKRKAFGVYDWDQARWECACGSRGHFGNQEKAKKNGAEHMRKQAGK